MRVHAVPSEPVRWIARGAIAAYREQRDWYELDEDAAEAAAIREVVEGCVVDLDAVAAERRVELEAATSQDEDLPW